MRKELGKHTWAYVILFLGLTTLAIAFFGAWPDRVWQRGVAVVIGLFYFAWGVTTHVKTEHISRRVVAEYAGVALLASFLLLFVTL